MKIHFKTALITLIFLFLSTTTVLAENKCGVNIGPNYSQVDQVVSMTKQGGWVVALGTPGNCDGFEGLFGKGVNVVIRAYNGGRTFTNEEALGWVATLGNLDTKGQVVYFMPWNEPNHDNEGGGSTAGNYVYQYSDTLRKALDKAGLLNTKVILLSPMVDKLNPSFTSPDNPEGSFFNNPGGKSGFYGLFQGSSINEYDQFNPRACTADAPGNNCRYDELGISSPFYALEAGVVAGGCSPPCYKDNELRQMLDASWGKWSGDGNFKMFAIFSYDPHRSGWDIFSASETTSFYQNTCTAGNINYDSYGADDAKKFDDWFSAHQDKLVQCDETCGYAPSLSYCAGTAFTAPDEGTGVPAARSGTDSRPFACESCNTTNKLIGSCATSFTVNDQISYKKKDGNYCGEGGETNPGWWVEKDWGGTIGIDPSSTTIPFVGKKGAESEQKYLADYFEGTDKYYYFYQDPIQRLSHSGVWRKLAPKQTQDKLKREMVVRYRSCNAADLGTHDYQIISENGDTAFLSEIYDHQPPLETETNYEEKYDIWANSNGGKWARLWTAVPMFSHEDTPGQIVAYVGTKIKDKYTPASQVEKVPHVARLYEATKAVMDILQPSKEESAQSLNSKTTVLAAAEKYQPEEKTLLAESSDEWQFCGPTGNNCFNASIRSICCSAGSGTLVVDANGYGHLTVTVNGAMVGFNALGQGLTYHFGCSANPGETFSVSAAATNYDVSGYSVTGGCSTTLDENAYACCAGGEAPVIPPSCGLPGANPIDACKKDALRDTNPNDTLCCSLMKINLSAVDDVINTEYTPCINIRSCGCEYVDLNRNRTNEESERFCCRKCGLNEHLEEVCVEQPSSACEDVVTVPVSRQVGITLSHPYLSEIWEYTAQDKTGVFNIFRPETSDKFKELDAASSIQYSYSHGTVDPATGSFYFPYLGGIQKAKEWVVRTLLPTKE